MKIEEKKSKLGETLMEKSGELAAACMRDIDPDRIVKRVRNIRAAAPHESTEELIEKLVKSKCQKAAAIGASTSCANVIPGVGTLLSLTIGLAVDITSLLKLQTELVLEIAEAQGHALSPTERNEVIVAVTGIASGFNQFGTKAVKALSEKVSEMAAQKWVAKAVPFVGFAASAGTNLLSTYLIGKRAHAYFSRGPEAMVDFKGNIRALTGVDERKIVKWLEASTRGAFKYPADAGVRMAQWGQRKLQWIGNAIQAGALKMYPFRSVSQKKEPFRYEGKRK